MPWLKVQSDGSLLLRVHAQPRAAKNEMAGLMGEALKIRLAAPPVDGKANRALAAWLAERLKLPRSAVTLKSGETGREKIFIIKGADEASARRLLEEKDKP